jgi:hypothetical protein
VVVEILGECTFIHFATKDVTRVCLCSAGASAVAKLKYEPIPSTSSSCLS